MPEKYDLEKILAEIEEDITAEEPDIRQEKNIGQKVINALRDRRVARNKGKQRRDVS